jgi:hypothetical protein
MIPLMAILLIAVLHWDQIAAFASGHAGSDQFALRLKSPPLPMPCIVGLLGAVLLFTVLPYLNELWRCLQARKGMRR